jgi:hypothetical protein
MPMTAIEPHERERYGRVDPAPRIGGFTPVADQTVKMAAGLAQEVIQLRERLSLVLGPGVAREGTDKRNGAPASCPAHGHMQEAQNHLESAFQVLREINERLWL